MKRIVTILLYFIFSIQYAITQDIDTNYLRGNSAFAHQNYKQAAAYLTKALQNAPNNTDLLLKTGIAHFNANRIDRAITYFEQVEKYKHGLASIHLARCYAAKDDVEKTIEYLKIHLNSRYRLPMNVIKLDKNFHHIHKNPQWLELWKKDWHTDYEMKISDASYELNYNNYSEAFTILDNILSKSKQRHEAYFVRGQVYEARDDLKNALKDYDKAVEIRKYERPYREKRAEVLLKMGKFRKARNDYDELIRQYPYQIDYYLKRAEALTGLDEYEEALRDIQLYLSIVEQSKEGKYLCGMIYYEQGDYFDALKYFNAIVDQHTTEAKYFIARGNTYFKTQTYKYAIKDYTMALDISPREGEVYYNRGIARQQTGDIKGACHDWKRALQYGFMQADEKLREFCQTDE